MRRLLIAALLVSGCSYFFQNRLPAEYSGNTEPFCSSSTRIAVLDTLIAVGDAATAIVAATGGAQTTSTDQTILTIAGIAGAVFYTASAIDGYSMTGDCRAARDRWDSGHGGGSAPTTTDDDSKRQLRLMNARKAPADAGMDAAPADGAE